MPLGLVVLFIAGLAELGRTPFDIHHAESEVVGGPFVEYSGAHWAVFYLAEYMNTFFIATLTVLLFFGGWSWPSPASVLGDSAPPLAVNALGAAWLMAKVYAVAGVIFWFRGTYPRLRIDQLMAFGWQVLIPLSFANLILVATVLYYGWPTWTLPLISVPLLAVVARVAFRRYADPRKMKTVRMFTRSTCADGETVLAPQAGES